MGTHIQGDVDVVPLSTLSKSLKKVKFFNSSRVCSSYLLTTRGMIVGEIYSN